MANVRIVYNNRIDAATLKSSDALPSKPTENVQQSGRVAVTRLVRNRALDSGAGSVVVSTPELTQCSIAAWIYDAGTTGPDIYVLASGTSSRDVFGLWVSDQDYLMKAGFIGNYGDPWTNMVVTSSGPNPSAVWDHYVAVFDAGSLKLYHNGNTYTGSVGGASSITASGYSNAVTLSLNPTANSLLANVRFYSCALTLDDANKLKAHRFISDDGMIDRWAFRDSNVSDYGRTLSGTPTYADGPDVNATASVVQIKGNWDAAETLNCFILCRTNLTSSATLRLRIYNAVDQGGSTVYDSGALASQISGTRTGDYANIAWYFTETAAARSFLLEINNGGTAVDIARIVAGKYWEPSVNVEFGAAMSWRDTATVSRTEGAALISSSRQVYRTMRLSFGRITSSERTIVSEMLYSICSSRELFVSMFPADGGSATNTQREMDYSLCGFANSPELSIPHWENYITQLTIEET